MKKTDIKCCLEKFIIRVCDGKSLTSAEVEVLPEIVRLYKELFLDA